MVLLGQAEADDVLVHLSVGPGVDHVDPHGVGDDGEQPVDQPDARDGCEEDKPEVEKDVDLLIDDVLGKDTQGVMLHQGARGSVLLEVALCHLKKE